MQWTLTRIVWLIGVGAAATALFLLVGNTSTIDNPGIAWGQALLITAMALFATVGAIINRYRPYNRMGWVFLGGAALGGVAFMAGEYALRGQARAGLPLAPYAGWLIGWIQFLAIYCLLVLTLFLFPVGTAQSRRWRVALWATGAAMLVVTLASALAPGPLDEPLQAWQNPVGLSGTAGRLLRAIATAAFPLVAVLLVVGAGAFVTRYRRSGSDQRRQLAWLMYAVTVTACTFALFAGVPHLSPVIEGVTGALFGAAVIAIPMAAGIGIMRYRLYDIDRIVRHSLVYSGLAVVVTGSYLLVVVGVGTLIGTRSDPALAVFATALAAVAFYPARARLTRLVNRSAQGGLPAQVELPITTVGLVIENERLVDELRASRVRILAAQDAERRRIERDLHDGAQQRLLNVSLAVGMVRAELGPNVSSELATALDHLTVAAQEALTELRELARGIHPAILTDRGLGPAVRSLLERSPVPALLATVSEGRLPAAVEATAYFVVAESLANAIKHGAPNRVDVEIARLDGHLLVLVEDDGIGGARVRAGGGLQGLADRVEVLGGRMELDSAPGTGTRVRAVIPCV